MKIYKVEKLTNYIISKVLRNNIAKFNNNSELLIKVKAKLNEEISARLCVLPDDNHTFDELVSAIESQINISEFIKQIEE